MATLTPIAGSLAAGAAAGATAGSAAAATASQGPAEGLAVSGYEMSPKLNAMHSLIVVKPHHRAGVWRYRLAQLALLSLAPFGLFAVPNSNPKSSSDTSLAECERALNQILMAPTPSWRATELSGMLRVLAQMGHWALFLRAVEEAFAAAKEVSDPKEVLTIHRHLAQEMALVLPTTLEEIPSRPVRNKLAEIVGREMPGAQADALYLNHLTTIQQTLAGWDRVTNGARPQLHAALAELAAASPPLLEVADPIAAEPAREPLPVEIVWQRSVEDEARLIRVGDKTRTMADWISSYRWTSRGKTTAAWLTGLSTSAGSSYLGWTIVHPAIGLIVGSIIVGAAAAASTPTDVRTTQKNRAMERFIREREFAAVMSNWYGLLIDALVSKTGIPLILEKYYDEKITKDAVQGHMQSGGAYRLGTYQQRNKGSLREQTVFAVVRDVSWQEVLDASVKDVDGKPYDLVQFMEMGPFWKLARKSARYAEILPAVEKKGRKWSTDDLKIIRDLHIQWPQDSVLADRFVPTVIWLAARGNESVVRWVHGYAGSGVTLAQEAFQQLLAANNPLAVELLAETHDAGKVNLISRKLK